ncbi:hypothetical protein HIM_10768 [Hirsutella minnesotensis 3608]|uniref:Aminoglycoside phosphotransferase domain-containing protein n=1 Tax=Hirsutella minnesotensis 3608 TaxID=1043627 RepID=A0A0F7ZJQ5_9HYPO|nr:hypothetical protein HIM_10768 [Hirsutella minnesotensis 3608]
MGFEDNANLPGQPSKTRVNKANRKTVAARYNVKVMRGLEEALLNDPEADITTALSSTYSQRLQSFKQSASTSSKRRVKPPLFDNDIRSRLNENDTVNIIFPPSAEVEALLHGYDSLAAAIVGILDNSEVLYESAWAASVMVFRINENIVVKAGHAAYSITEHRTLTFLQEHLAGFPAPKPHGLIRLGVHCFLFTSYIAGINLEKAWPQLDCSQKQDISHQLDVLLSELRTLPVPENASIGDVAGGGCRDLRRSQRVSTEPITSVRSFEDFIFSGSNTSSPLYIGLLRDLMPQSTKIVLTHGDLRPANIMLRTERDGVWSVAAIIDWESSGFYPEYWEAVKATNLLTPRDYFDWYKYIPPSIAPRQYPIQWLVDRLWDRNAANG